LSELTLKQQLYSTAEAKRTIKIGRSLAAFEGPYDQVSNES